MNINIPQIHLQCTHDVVKGIYNTVIPNLGNSYISKVLHSHRYTDLICDALNCNISIESFDHGVKPHVDTGQRQHHWCVLLSNSVLEIHQGDSVSVLNQHQCIIIHSKLTHSATVLSGDTHCVLLCCWWNNHEIPREHVKLCVR